MLAATVVGAFFALRMSRHKAVPLPPFPEKSIAVLPFLDLSQAKDQEYFCDGMSEEILDALAKVDGLRVVARTSSFSFKGKNPDVSDLGKKLNVENVVEGSVRRDGNRVRISAQLINARNGLQLWSETYERELQGVFALQDEITRSIVEALKSFKSVKRRLEVKAEVNGITIIDDFAHHPTAIAVTLNALRGRYPGRRLWAILEPRSNTLRRNVFQSALTKSLAIADETVIANVFKSESIPEAERLDVEAVAAAMKQSGRHARVLPDVDAIVRTCAPEMRSGDVVAILSNGGFGGIYEKLPHALKASSVMRVEANR
jgi:TolB-like protein